LDIGAVSICPNGLVITKGLSEALELDLRMTLRLIRTEASGSSSPTVPGRDQTTMATLGTIRVQAKQAVGVEKTASGAVVETMTVMNDIRNLE
jgi:hypothetical protein